MKIWLAALLLAISGTFAGTGHAFESVPYWVITPQPPAPAVVQPRPKTRYAYGWFGANPRPQGVHRHSVHRTYTDWIFR